MKKNVPAKLRPSHERSRLHVSLSQSGLTVTGENALAIIAAVGIVVAVLAATVVMHLA